LIFRAVPRFFFFILTTPRTSFFSALEEKMRERFQEEAPLALP
jgi:hypothetical protein